MNTTSKPNKQSNQPAQPNFRKSMIIWLIILLVMMLFYVPKFLYSPKAIEIPYSEFKHQVETGNVSEVSIKGEEIRGTFENEYMASEESKKEGYSSFVTVMPTFADPDLIHILEENTVTIKAKK